jgi:serine/threonine protein kinase
VFTGGNDDFQNTKERLSISIVYVYSGADSEYAMDLLSGATYIASDQNGNCVFQTVDDKKGKVVVKQISLSPLEARYGDDTSDLHDISRHRHRNWRWTHPIIPKVPNLSGINPSRERIIYDILKSEHYVPNTIVMPTHNRVFKDDPLSPYERSVPDHSTLDSSDSECEDTESKNFTNLNYVRRQRRGIPVPQYWLIQEYAGITLEDIIARYHESDPDHQVNQVVVGYLKQVVGISKHISERGVVHGDLTPDNVCVSESGVCSLIDFGWCTHHSMMLTSSEARRHVSNLRTGFDMFHFCKSLGCIAPEYRGIMEMLLRGPRNTV